MYEEELQDSISKQKLPELESLIIEKLATEVYGVDQAEATAFFASLTNRTTSECSQAIIGLVGRKLLRRIDDGTETRLVLNYQLLGISEEAHQALLKEAQPFEMLDHPHSERAMSTLASLFREESETIYIALAEVTSISYFRELKNRAEAGHRTVFLIPKRRHLAPVKWKLYDEILAEWVSFIQEGNEKVRRNIQILITPKPFRHLYTSALGPKYVRYDMFEYDALTTRGGVMIKVERGVSLYDLVYRQYCEAVFLSSPLRKLWPRDWLLRMMRKYFLTTVLLCLAYVLMLMEETVTHLLALVVAGLAYHAIYDDFKYKLWSPPDLYKRS